MTLPASLIPEGFRRVERDDRLFDVFPHLTREHGVEVWEKWTPKTVELILIHFQNPRSKPKHVSFSRKKLEQALVANKTIS